MNAILLCVSLVALFAGSAAKGIEYKFSHSEELTDRQFAQDLHKASRDNDSAAAHRLARHYWAQQKFSDALAWMRSAAIMGHLQSQHEFYVFVKAQLSDDRALNFEAVLWLETACKNKYEAALFQQKAIAESNDGRDARANYYYKFKVN